ncbi:RNA polymerase sigma factor [Paractinoplanes abujensis]|uniref:RNA polymerase sigma-70 factor (ECF subfamily) n=1 Tax=Paractinoplanes abujensis TaxID=882441 RepID=A0A7W7CTU9_9ACTN|nr:sigma-70 family RNA polymerase sigma factor [Actinoplanes abujensis]MBB4694279.1 RNA polymerase sigma-70 factor (ECF subfamily) [Actinoplanes abujensis]GID20508.1 RNA polymerase sigma factor [Actinoplanes abujensis]
MNELDVLAARFERDRAHLRTVAQRILGSADEADDAVQEAWMRLSRSDTGDVGNLTGWLTTVVSRICLDMLRSRASRREDLAELPEDLPVATPGPEQQAVQYDAIGPALLLVLDTLGPSERLAFVLHDTFAVPFGEIATIVGCSPAAARQLASRARRRVQGQTAVGAPDVERRREIVEAFLAAAQGGDFERLLTLLDPEVVLRADAASVRMGAAEIVNGAAGVAGVFNGRAHAATVALVDGVPGLVWASDGQVRVVFRLVFDDDAGRIAGIEQVADPSRIAGVRIA